MKPSRSNWLNFCLVALLQRTLSISKRCECSTELTSLLSLHWICSTIIQDVHAYLTWSSCKRTIVLWPVWWIDTPIYYDLSTLYVYTIIVDVLVAVVRFSFSFTNCGVENVLIFAFCMDRHTGSLHTIDCKNVLTQNVCCIWRRTQEQNEKLEIIKSRLLNIKRPCATQSRVKLNDDRYSNFSNAHTARVVSLFTMYSLLSRIDWSVRVSVSLNVYVLGTVWAMRSNCKYTPMYR